jgi:hypothetical protein
LHVLQFLLLCAWHKQRLSSLFLLFPCCSQGCLSYMSTQQFAHWLFLSHIICCSYVKYPLFSFQRAGSDTHAIGPNTFHLRPPFFLCSLFFCRWAVRAHLRTRARPAGDKERSLW